MKEISLTQGKVALVDDDDFEWLYGLTWHCARNRKDETSKFYALRSVHINGRQINILMHRDIAGKPGLHVDHKDGNGLNNQRFNLRVCTPAQNQMNRIKAFGSIKFKGVYWSKQHKKWHAQLQQNRKTIHLGFFEYSVDAAIAYNNEALKRFGEFAALNVIPE